MLPNHARSIRDRLGDASECVGRFLWGAGASVSLGDLLRCTSLGGRLPELSGRSVLIATQDQLAAGLGLVELDGGARRVVICPPDLSPEHLPSGIARAGVDAIVSHHALHARDVPVRVICRVPVTPAG